MFRTYVHVTMPFCACGDDAKLVSGMHHLWNVSSHFVECTRCSHREQSRVEQAGVTIVLESSGQHKPPNFRD